MRTPVMIFVGLILVGLLVYNIARPLFHSPKDRVKILMGGRSTMGLWFKHWNWPYPLRIKATYRSWPIPYDKYARGKLYLEYLPLNGPKSKDPNVPFGENMINSFEAGLDRDQYDAAFFKFCFVDFPVKNDEWKHRLNDLTNIILKAHEITSKRKIKLIIGNALPLPEPNDGTLYLQKEYNSWLLGFATSHDDIMVFDFFGRLTDKNGRLKNELGRGSKDHHPNDRAFSVLDKAFFKECSDWLGQ